MAAQIKRVEERDDEILELNQQIGPLVAALDVGVSKTVCLAARRDPVLDMHPDRPLRGIPGAPPRLDAMPPGCRFAPSCPHAFERCPTERPPDYATEGGRAAYFLLDPSEPRQ